MNQKNRKIQKLKKSIIILALIRIVIAMVVSQVSQASPDKLWVDKPRKTLARVIKHPKAKVKVLSFWQLASMPIKSRKMRRLRST